ncbi:Hypothetical predicted protein [Olea europaea subsp. europaea]|uniref:Uncharacterized protein n=1 Tax=Olea europaea subsp. europaea TaxID=158383 RepID=A0A8S0T5K2_OLEEU|nr:Hypothetical predicted protein [Olea europaea subsp. europaea]
MGHVLTAVGTSSIFRHLYAVCGHGVQAISRTRSCRVSETRLARHVQDAVGTHPDFEVFLGYFWNIVCRQCSGCVWATARMQSGFQAFLGSFWDTVCRPCPGYYRDTSWFSCISRQFLGHDEQDLECRPCSGPVMATVGTEPNFQAILGHVRDASWPRQGWSLIFRQFWAVSRTRCAGHVQDATDASKLSGIFRKFLEHGVQAMSGTRLDHGLVRDASWLRQGHSLIFRHF